MVVRKPSLRSEELEDHRRQTFLGTDTHTHTHTSELR